MQHIFSNSLLLLDILFMYQFFPSEIVKCPYEVEDGDLRQQEVFCYYLFQIDNCLKLFIYLF